MEALKLNDKVTLTGDGSNGLGLFRGTITGIGPHRAVCMSGARERDLDLADEGKRWARGWGGAAVLALGRVEARRLAGEAKKERDRKKAEAVAEQKRTKDAEDRAVARLQSAVRVVTRAKVPRDLRETALQYALMQGMTPFFWR